jgi:hypothetical protein
LVNFEKIGVVLTAGEVSKEIIDARNLTKEELYGDIYARLTAKKPQLHTASKAGIKTAIGG